MDFDSLVDDSQHPSASGQERGPASGLQFDQLVDDEEKYGGFSGEAKSFGLGAARSASFGLSDEFLTRTGLMSPEELKGYKETNPVATGAGEVGGVLGSVLAPEAGILGAITKPVKAVSELGGAVTEGATPIAERIAGAVANPETAPIVNKVLSQAGAHAAGSAVEGAFYGLGQSISEDALGDPDAMGEKLLSNVGIGAITGGALGGVLKGAGIGIPEALKKAGVETESLRSSAESLLAKAAATVSGKSEEDIKALLKGIGTKEGAEMRKQALEGHKEREESARSFTEKLSDQYKAMKQSLKEYYSDARPEEISELMKQVPLETTFNHAVDMAGSLKQEIKAMRAEPEIYAATGKVRQLEIISDGLEKNLTNAKTSEDVYHALNDAKAQIQSHAKFGGVPTDAERQTINRLKSIAKDFRVGLENPEIWGEGGARQAALNSAASDFFASEKDMLKHFGRKMANGEVVIDTGKVNTFLNQMGRPGADIKQQVVADYMEASKNLTAQMAETNKNSVSNIDTGKLSDLFEKTQAHIEGAESEHEAINQLKRLKRFDDGESVLGAGVAGHYLGAPGALLYGAYHTLRNPAELVRVLSNVERATMKVTNAVNKGAAQIFKIPEGVKSSAIAYGSAKYASIDDKRDNHDTHAPALYELSNNPEKLLNRLNETTQNISPYAPKTASGLQQTMTRATQFLQSKLPGQDVPQKPLSPKYQPSDAEVSKWHKYFSVVEDPTQALHQVAQGTLIPETMEALQAVYPKMLSEMQQSVMEKMTEHVGKGKSIPYSRKLSLSMFLGSDLVNSLDPKSMVATQNVLATATMSHQMQQAGQMGRVNKSALGKMEKSNRTLTAAQASAQRTEA